MKNFLIFLSIFVVGLLATMDAKDRLKELDNLTIKTPSQVEMKKHPFEKPKEEEYNSFNKKEHQNNALPQNKQEKPLTKKNK